MTVRDWRALVRDTLENITGDPAHDADIVEELAQHISQRFDEHVARGNSESRSLDLALSELAEPVSLKRSLRDSARQRSLAVVPPVAGGRSSVWNDFAQDLRYGTRVLLRSRGFAAAAILTLAIGIGATTAIFSVVNAVLLQPVPFRELDRMVMVWQTDRNTGTNREPSSLPDFIDVKERSRQLSDAAGFIASEGNITPVDGDTSRVPVLFSTSGLLDVLGIQPAMGRGFTAEEDIRGQGHVAMISDRLWEQQFQRATNVVGRTIRLSDLEYTIVGVVPASADFGAMQILRSAAYGRGFADRDLRSRVDVWLPMGAVGRELVRSTHPLLVLGRLAPGASVASAQSELTSIMADLEAQYAGSNVARGAFVESMNDVIFSRVRGTLWVLLAAVGFVLLIACVNVANLLLARGTARLREVAVRTAMGAPLRRLVRQFAAENLVMTSVATILGMAIALLALKLMVAVAPADIPRITDVRIDGVVLAVATGLAIFTGLVFGVVPAIQARRVDLQGALKSDESRGASASRERGLLRSTLVVSEVALAVVLLVGAGLLVKSAWRLSQVETGYSTENVVKAEFQLPPGRYPTQNGWPNFVEVHRFNDDLMQRVRGLPGVQAAAIVGNHPVDPGSQNSWRVVGRESEGANWPEVSIRRVSTSYLETVRLPLASGRAFGDGDGPADPAVSIINEALARRFFEGREPLGQQIALWGSARTIVGVVKDERINGLAREAPPAIYLPFRQAPSFNGAEALLVRTSAPISGLVNSLRGAVRQVDPQLAVFGIQSLEEVLGASVAQQRFVMLLLIAFSGVAVILAAIGIHGILSYTIAQRRHELGIRIALGATPGRVTNLVLGQGARLTAVGLLIGVLAAFALTRVIASQLYGVSATDLTAFAAVLPVLGAVAMLATWLPARRAVRLDPLDAMRD